MLVIRQLLWDSWNEAHIAQHSVTKAEVEDVCHGQHTMRQSYRKRILIVGTTNAGRELAVVLSPEDENLRPYSTGIYYPITAYEKGVRP